MSRRSSVIFAAILCLVSAWGALFAGWILGFDWAVATPAWFVLSLLIAAGVLAAVSRRTARTRWGIGVTIVLTGASLASVQIAKRNPSDLEGKWWRTEAQAIATTLLAVGEEIARLESVADAAGERVSAHLRDISAGDGRWPLRDRYEDRKSVV